MPASLDGPGSAGGRERARAIEFYGDRANRDRGFTYKAYKEPDVTLALEAMFGGKCAYCESFYASSMPMDGEHYRPKGAVARTDGSLSKPGYYWLASDWGNLLPSCIDCNRARGHEHRGGTRKSGKANWFPLIDEGLRAEAPGEELREEPLLLNPCDDAPEDHLEFGDEGVVRAVTTADGSVSVRGDATITIMGLDRPRLAQDRHGHLLTVDVAIDRFRKAVRRLDADPEDPQLADDLRLEVAELRRLTAPATRYAAMARQRIEAALGALGVDA